MKRALQIIRDGHAGTPIFLNEPLAEGEQGNVQTLGVMAKIVREDRLEPDYRRFVLREIVGGTRGHDFRAEAERCFLYARDRIVYRRDPVSMERVADMWSTLYGLGDVPEGDCGIKSTFLATCLALLGHKPFFTVIKQRPEQKAFNHVYVGAYVGGQVVYMDPTPNEAPIGWEADSVMKLAYQIF